MIDNLPIVLFVLDRDVAYDIIKILLSVVNSVIFSPVRED